MCMQSESNVQVHTGVGGVLDPQHSLCVSVLVLAHDVSVSFYLASVPQMTRSISTVVLPQVPLIWRSICKRKNKEASSLLVHNGRVNRLFPLFLDVSRNLSCSQSCCLDAILYALSAQWISDNQVMVV